MSQSLGSLPIPYFHPSINNLPDSRLLLRSRESEVRLSYINIKLSQNMYLMEQDSLPTEVILTHPRQSLGSVQFDWIPQPGNYLDLEGKTYAVLERSHKYHLKSGRYHLHKIAIYVQSAQRPTEKTLVNGRWVVGDASCLYNANSEIIRCAVNPNGPCDSCHYYKSAEC